jgi:hypothetical protein
MNHCSVGNLFFSLELEIFYMEHTTNTINILFNYHNVSTILLIKLALISKYREYTNPKSCYNMDVLQSILNMVLQHKLVANSTTISTRKHMVGPLCKPLILQWYHYKWVFHRLNGLGYCLVFNGIMKPLNRQLGGLVQKNICVVFFRCLGKMCVISGYMGGFVRWSLR